MAKEGNRFEELALELKKLATELSSQSDVKDMLQVQLALQQNNTSNPHFISPRELACNMDKYPSTAARFGGLLPLDPYSNATGVVVQSSNEWKQSKYVYPKSMPSFRKWHNERLP